MTAGRDNDHAAAVPEWFYDARDGMRGGLDHLARRTGRDLPPLEVRPAADPQVPRPGEIRAIFDDPTSEGPRLPHRLVVVRSVDADRGAASVALLSDDTRMAGEGDVELQPDRTDLAYPVIVESDVVGDAWFSQFGEALGAVDERTLDGIIEAEATGVPNVPRAWRGLPLTGPGDPRRAFKEAEARGLEALTLDCRAALSSAAQEEILELSDEQESGRPRSEGDSR